MIGTANGYEDSIKHHGIKGQKWGVRRFQNEDGSLTYYGKKRYGVVNKIQKTPSKLSEKFEFSDEDKKKIKKAAKVAVGVAVVAGAVYLGKVHMDNSMAAEFSKKYADTVLPQGTILQTLSYDPTRTKGADMFYAAHTEFDKHQYNVLFNQKLGELRDVNGNIVGRDVYKVAIKNKIVSDMKIASEKSGTEAFSKLFGENEAVRQYVLDSGMMEKRFMDAFKDRHIFKGYRESLAALKRVRANPQNASKRDIDLLYRLFNYTLPNTDPATVSARTAFFSSLKDLGYSGCLDVNDALYGGFKATSPVIVFDQAKLFYEGFGQTTLSSKQFSATQLAAKKILGV